MGMNWAEHTVDIDAPIETAFAAIVDYESFPRWQDAVDSVEVLSRTGDGLGEDVKLFVDAKVRKIDYVLRYAYVRPTEITWDFVEGNGMRDCDGVYTLEELAPERTRATYKLGADPAIPVPGMVMRRTHKALVKRSVEDLKNEAERRHAAGEGAETATPDAPAAGAEDVRIGAENEPTPGREAEDVPVGVTDDWVPKAERDAATQPRTGSREPDPGAPRPSGAGASSLPHAELLGKAVNAGKGAADGAVRAGMGAAEQAVGIGRDVADGLIRRVNRKLGNDD